MGDRGPVPVPVSRLLVKPRLGSLYLFAEEAHRTVKMSAAGEVEHGERCHPLRVHLSGVRRVGKRQRGWSDTLEVIHEPCSEDKMRLS